MAQRSYVLAGLALILALAIGAISYALWPSPPQGALVVELRPHDQAFVAQGLRVYSESCASCHGSNLEGQLDWRQRNASGRLPAPPHDETGHTWHHPDAALFELTKFGPAALIGGGYQSDMPGYEGILTDQEILAALSYIKSTWSDEIRGRHDQINAGGRHH